MSGFNLPDNVSPNDPRAPWNQEEKPTRVIMRIEFFGQKAIFESEWEYTPTREEVLTDFLDNARITVEYEEIEDGRC